jgi:hypothetical protein
MGRGKPGSRITSSLPLEGREEEGRWERSDDHADGTLKLST